MANSKAKGKIIVSKEMFAIATAKKKVDGSFAVIQDRDELTVIFDQNKLSSVKKDLISVEKDYRLITFDMILDFSLVGFIARISKALAEEKIPIFVISGFSTDHIFIKNEYLAKAIKKLEKMGFTE
jgi:hypothetical protein